MKTTRQTQKTLTRKKLVTAAMKLFAKQGIIATNTAAIAKSAGVSHGTLFLHFPCRDDIIFAVLSRFGRSLCTAFKLHTSKNIKSLKCVLKAHLRVIEEFEDFYTHLVMEISLLAPKLKSFFFMLHASVSYRMFVNAQQDMQEGKIRPISRPLLFNTWIALIHYYLVHKDIFSPKKSVIKEKSPELLTHFMNLISLETRNN